MTREEAIKSALKFLLRKQQEQGSWGYADNDSIYEVSWNEIIKWVDQRSCGDCISREAATDRFDLVQSDDKCMGYDDILAFLSSLPSVEPERKTGLWMDPEQGICWCSICGCRAEEVSNYCPDCGAQMRPNWKKMEVDK